MMTVDARTEGGVRWLVLNRPESGNSITRAMQREVMDNPRKASADPEIRAVVLTATGTKHFCTGPNLLDPQMRPSQDRVAGDAAPTAHGIPGRRLGTAGLRKAGRVRAQRCRGRRRRQHGHGVTSSWPPKAPG